MRAPKKVPAERMDVIKEVLDEEIAVASAPWMARMKTLDARTPLM